MDRSRYCNKLCILYVLLMLSALFACGGDPLSTGTYRYEGYRGSLNLKDHPWLKGRRIFIDPGHGGKGAADRFRIGPGGITEERINLRVALILEKMLKEAGAETIMSRRSDSDVSLDDRAAMVEKSAPDILISIHHNGSPRRADEVDYPAVLIWGNRFIRPASFDFARYLLEEFHNMSDTRGRIISDFAVFQETGTRILRKTAGVCPGIIGEAGFFSSEAGARHFSDPLYNEREAEAYFRALSRYFHGGLPSAEVRITSAVDNGSYLQNMIKDRSPEIFIKVKSDSVNPDIDRASFEVTLDGVPVSVKKCGDTCYRLLYGNELYPGGHRVRFRFRNRNGHSSMVYSACFTVEINKGDFERLVKRGRALINRRTGIRQGLFMLLSALSMEQTGPSAQALVKDISRGFAYLGLHAEARYYGDSSNYFYPDGDFKLTRRDDRWYTRYGDYHPVKYHGRTPVMHFGDEDGSCTVK